MSLFTTHTAKFRLEAIRGRKGMRNLHRKTKYRSLIAGVVVCALLCNVLTSCSTGDKAQEYSTSSKSADDSAWEICDSGTVTLSNSRIRFELDTQTTHFTVTDLEEGREYHSALSAGDYSLDAEDEARLVSEVTACYYTEQSTALYMYSGTDSVDNGTFTIKTDGKAIRVYYKMGEPAIFAPVVFDKDTFENTILPSLGSDGLRRRMQRYYVLYGGDEKMVDYDEKLKQYPAISKTPLYLLSDTVSELEQEEISGFMEEIEFTAEIYAQKMDELGIDLPEDDATAGFTIPVEYTITEDGFTASILADLIKENSSEFKLQSVELLECFASIDESEQGYYLVPDGSGALLPVNGEQSAEYESPFYGQDYSVLQETLQQISENLLLPVFGVSTDKTGIFAVVEQAAEAAQLHIKPISSKNPQNHIYTQFTIRSLDVTDIGKEMQIPIYNLFVKNRLTVSPVVRYVLLKSGESDYNHMARWYSNYLESAGKLTKREYANQSVHYLDFLCMITEEASVVGIPYTRKTVLSTVSEIQDTVKQLYSENVYPLVVRLIGYSSGGLEHAAYNTFSIDKKVGTVAELEQLSSLLQSKGGQLILDSDFQFASGKQNGFNPTNDAAHYLNRTIVRTGQHDIATRIYNSDVLPRYFISPARYKEYAAGYISSLKKVWKSESLPGMSYSSAGQYLGGDYSNRLCIDRTAALEQLTSALSETANTTGIIVNGGNSYTFPYAEHILGVPLTSSELDIQQNSVPFYQMVIHGQIPYAGTPFNLSVNAVKSRLLSIAYGAAPYAALITRDDRLISDTPYASMYYSLGATGQMNTLIEYFAGAGKVLQASAGSAIIMFEQLSDTLTRTTYENGLTVTVNFSDQPQTTGETEIPAFGYICS